MTLTQAATPKSLGFAMPAEWSVHAATWLSWPHNRETWPHDFADVEAVWVEMTAVLSEVERVRVNVLDTAHAAHVLGLLQNSGRVNMAHIETFLIPTNDSWVRDHGPVFLTGPQGVAVTDFGYNAWGGKYPPFEDDNAVPRRVAAALGLPRFEADMILEGGSIEVNGQGLLLVTESCLLAPTRNPHLSREQIEQRLKDFLGAEKVLWLPGGDMTGDDTDGHIDNLARFTPTGPVVAVCCLDAQDENHAVLAENFRALKQLVDMQGRPFEVVTLPMPDPVVQYGLRLPASYVNYLVANGVVLLPVFGVPQDDTAVGVLSELFPHHRVVSVFARAMIWGQGAIHCSTQQQPRAPG